MVDVTNGTDFRCEGSAMPLDIELSEHDESLGNDISDVTGKAAKRQAKIVGGWISPYFAKDIDRSWLEGHVPPCNNKQAFNLSTYVPQIGDIVLYVYHRRFQFCLMHSH